MNSIEFKKKLHGGQLCLGAWATLTDPVVPEVMSHLGFDWLLIDTEHTAITIDTLQMMMLMIQRGGTPAIVRLPWNDPVMIKQALDVGADGILAPMVHNADEARKAVEAAKYPPQGTRGFGPRVASDFFRRVEEYAHEANDRTVVMVQIEHIDAVNNLDDILQVPGLDGILIGPSDLSFSMGIPLQWDHPELIDTIKLVAQKARTAGIPVGGAVDDTLEETLHWIDWGMQFVTLGLDWQFMQDRAREMLNAVREGAIEGESRRVIHKK